MGIGIVLIVWAVAGLVVAAIASAVLGSVTTAMTLGTPWRTSIRTFAVALPFIFLAFTAGLFVFQAVVNEKIFHRDPGLGDSWRTPIPNGYEIRFIDVTDAGWLGPKTSDDSPVTSSRDSDGVCDLQIEGPFFIGSRAEDWVGISKPKPNSYFILDSRTNRRTDFGSLMELKKAAADLGIVVKLKPIADIYSQYRVTWFDHTILAIWVLFQIATLAALGAAIFLARRIRNNSPEFNTI